jgi:hypothetical protein
MDGTFGEPQLVVHDPPAIILVFGLYDTADRADVGARTPRIKLEEHAVRPASPSRSRQTGLLGRYEQVRLRKERCKVCAE